MSVRNFVPLHKFCTRLPAALPKNGCVIPFDLSQNCLASSQLACLGPDEYTTVCISDDINIEFMDLYCEKGHFLVSRKDPMNWQCGDKIEFVNNMIVTPTEPVASEEKAEGWSGIFCAGNYDLTVEKGLIVACEKVRCIPQGQVLNMAACFNEQGCIEEVAEGQPLRVAKSCTNCGA